MNEVEKIVTLDLETNILNKTIGGNKASPFWAENGIVLGAMESWNLADGYETGGNWAFISTIDEVKDAASRKVIAEFLEENTLIVGHNIKFDLLYIRKFYNELYLDWLAKGGRVWDTMVVEYLLSGHSKMFPSLNHCALKYGGTVKDDKIKEYWDNDIDTADIPFEELMPYLVDDIKNTSKVFLGQMEAVMKNGMVPLVVAQMDALLALVEIEWNGMRLDVENMRHKWSELVIEEEKAKGELIVFMEGRLPASIKAQVLPSSPQQLSCILFGGEVRCLDHVPVLDAKGKQVRYKSGLRVGEIKTKREEYKITMAGLTLAIKKPGKNGYYSTDDETLEDLLKTPITTTTKHFIEKILAYRTLQKDISTYYEGLFKLVFDGEYIHPNYNQCNTGTGRTSSSAPNAQNISGKKDE